MNELEPWDSKWNFMEGFFPFLLFIYLLNVLNTYCIAGTKFMSEEDGSN